MAASPSFIISESPASLGEVVGEVGVLALGENFVDSLQPALDVKQLLPPWPCDPSQQYRLSADVVIKLRLESAVLDQIDLAAQDLLDQLLEAKEPEC